MTGKTKDYLIWIPSLALTLFMTTGAVLKFIHAPQLVTLYSRIGLHDRMALLGITELIFLSLFLWPRTMKMGFFFLTAYYGGAMAIEITLGMIPLAPAVILTIIWIAAFLRNPSLFWSAKKQNKVLASL